MTTVLQSAGPILLSPPDVGAAEEAALLRAFRSGWIAPLGPEVDAFEAELAARCGRREAVALSSGTAALHLGLLNLGVGPGQVVLTSTLTFAATTNAIHYTGAEPVFVDADATGSMNPELLAAALSAEQARGSEVTAIVPVDLFGKVVDHAAIGAIAARAGLPVLSDAAESLGATRAGRPAPAYGVAAAVSFNGNKIMTTSGGGALLTDDAEFAARTRYLATQAKLPAAHYEHSEIGYNYRLSNLLAGLGRAQLERLEEMLERRRRWRRGYAALVAELPGVRLLGAPDGADDPAAPTRDNCWLTSVLIDPAQAGFDAAQLRLALAAEQIESRPLWKPMHAQPVFAHHRSYLDGTSDRLFATGLSLPSGSALTEGQFARVTDTITRFAERG
ncbi:aminotransferase class I/II-fold pyridoxal phosphate-dependent enzyme [Granulicoccus phenolivorans]|uniref:aminotransferase class I/II-fold pyridoxal phosphate-dependent enzyme n=1 Tax=Granulicoccus phenolivorans TaxID=266854 RepID=UPI000403FB6B|nr:aminotransferase class I/II-fold pyridoxal phosphate-dependent enzyme [Granulicoccus phenolivorans]